MFIPIFIFVINMEAGCGKTKASREGLFLGEIASAEEARYCCESDMSIPRIFAVTASLATFRPNPLLMIVVGLTWVLGMESSGKERALPSSIMRGEDHGKYSYTVAGLLRDPSKKDPSDTGSSYATSFPDAAESFINREKRIFTVLTSRPLSVKELREAIDESAHLGGDLPYWVELEMRSLPKASELMAFQVRPWEGDFPKNVVWRGVPWRGGGKAKPLRLPLRYGSGHRGTLVISPATAHCMCHTQYAIRVLDKEGRVVWHDFESAFGGCSVALTDQNADGIDEILLTRHDHGTEARLIISSVTPEDAGKK